MIGLLTVTHECSGQAFITAAEQIIRTRQAFILNLPVYAEDNADEIYFSMQVFINHLSACDSVLIMTDLYGSTPCNVARKFIQADLVEVIAGLNLPMLLRAIQHREKTLPALINKIISSNHGIVWVHPQ